MNPKKKSGPKTPDAEPVIEVVFTAEGFEVLRFGLEDLSVSMTLTPSQEVLLQQLEAGVRVTEHVGLAQHPLATTAIGLRTLLEAVAEASSHAHHKYGARGRNIIAEVTKTINDALIDAGEL